MEQRFEGIDGIEANMTDHFKIITREICSVFQSVVIKSREALESQ